MRGEPLPKRGFDRVALQFQRFRGALTNAPAGQWRRHLAVVLDGLRA